MRIAAARVRLMTIGLWLLVVLGPLMGGAALLRPAPTPNADPVVERPPAGVEGLAELTVLAHLAAVGGTVDGWTAPAAAALRLTGSPLDGLSGEAQATAARAVGRPTAGAVAVATTPAGPGRWGVTVAVQREGQVEGWQVTVAATDEGLAVETLPALVPLPGTGTPAPPDLPVLRAPGGDDPLAAAVARFLAAFLTDEGELSRYLAAGVAPDRPAVIGQHVELRRIAARPLDDSRVVVLAEARLIRQDGAVHVMHYPLLMQPAEGRWEVARLLPALPVRSTAP
jgi:hypothetical protein